MIKVQKRIMKYCEGCDEFSPICYKKLENDGTITTIVECSNADICSNAVYRYCKFLKTVKKENKND